MANKNQEKVNTTKNNTKKTNKTSEQAYENPALDAAIAAAISAPKPPKGAQLSYNKKKPAYSKKNASKSKPDETKTPIEKTQEKPAQPEKTAKKTKSKKNDNKSLKTSSAKTKTNAAPSETSLDFNPHAELKPAKGAKLKIIPLGGLNEVGKNMTLLEYGNDIIIIDCGMTFPDAEMPGVDIVIPDFTYVEKNADKIRGVLLTHGHEDHIGGVPYLLKKLNVPLYGTKLTLGLVENKLKEHNLGGVKKNIVVPGQMIRLGTFAVEFIRVNHSIPDAVAICVKTPLGNVIHMGDFKVDYTPIEGGIIDLPRLAQLGSEGVLALMSDSTNSERPGFTPSERRVGECFEHLFTSAEGKRIIIATFSSNVHRVQQIMDCAARHNRKVAIFGRSMINVVKMGIELGYLKAPEGILIDIDKMHNYPSEKIVLITTGSQGEPMSALTRMALNDHRQVSITSNDYIIISARPIPGNEKFVGRVVNELLKLGAEVVYEEMYAIHVSGHACQEEQKLILTLTRPKFFIPVHGEFKHLSHHALTAAEIGISEKNIIIADIGNVIETDGKTMRLNGTVPSGKVMVDGYGVGDVGAIVLKDRKHLAQDGVIVASFTIDRIDRRLLSGPDIVTRGFVYERESEQLLDKAKELTKSIIEDELHTRHDYTAIKNKVRDELGDYIFSKTKRRPMIIPIILDI